MRGYPGNHAWVPRKQGENGRLETRIASLFGQQLGFLFSEGNGIFVQPENQAVAAGELFKWSLANVVCAAAGNEIHASSVVILH